MSKYFNKANKVWTVITLLGFVVVVILLIYNYLKFELHNTGSSSIIYTYKNCPHTINDTKSEAGDELTTDKSIGVIDFDKDTVLGVKKDSILSIDKPSFINAQLASNCISPEDVVYAVTINKVTKLYPQKILNWHEIVNDEFVNSGTRTKIIFSYSPITDSPTAFINNARGQSGSFGVSGRLYQSIMLMFDRDTETLWSQFEGTALIGKLTGTKLELIQVETSTFKRYSDVHPEAQVLSFDTGYVRNYDLNPYSDYLATGELYYPAEKDLRLGLKQQVVGVGIDNKFKAYPLDSIDENGVLDKINSRDIYIQKNKLTGVIEVSTVEGGKKKSHYYASSFWFTWVAAHPSTEIYFK